MIGRVQRTKGLHSTFSHGSERGSSGFHSYNNACASFSDYALFAAPYSILLHYLKHKIRVKSHCVIQPFSKSVSDRDCSRNQAAEKGVEEVKATITHLCHIPNELQEPPNCCICFFLLSPPPSSHSLQQDPYTSATCSCGIYQTKQNRHTHTYTQRNPPQPLLTFSKIGIKRTVREAHITQLKTTP